MRTIAEFLQKKKGDGLVKIDCVDLGLPSGTKWCSKNVGAKNQEDHGKYYQWGDVKEAPIDSGKSLISYKTPNYEGILTYKCPYILPKDKDIAYITSQGIF